MSWQWHYNRNQYGDNQRGRPRYPNHSSHFHERYDQRRNQRRLDHFAPVDETGTGRNTGTTYNRNPHEYIRQDNRRNNKRHLSPSSATSNDNGPRTPKTPKLSKIEKIESVTSPNEIIERERIGAPEANSSQSLAEGVTEAITHQRKSGTAGIAGHLYETKTTTLVLLNSLLAIKSGKLHRFYLGTNVDGIGAADDIVMKYTIHGEEKPKILFIQCKHKDSVEKKVNLKDVMGKKGDYSLFKLLDSYICILQKCVNGDDVLLKEASNDIDIDIIMYTSSEANLQNAVDEIQVYKNDLIFTNEAGQIFQFKDKGDLVKTLLELLLKNRPEEMAKCITNFILTGESDIFTRNYLVQTYNVWLGQHILQISPLNANNKREVRFHKHFFNNKDNIVSQIRECLYTEILENINKLESVKWLGQPIKWEEIENIYPFVEIAKLKVECDKNQLSLNQFKNKVIKIPKEAVNKILRHIIIERLHKMPPLEVPATFGNFDIKIEEEKLDSLCEILIKILRNPDVTSNNFTAKIDCKFIERNKIITDDILKAYEGIGSLIGNIFILDEETNMLKFNVNENLLLDNQKSLLRKLNQKILEHHLYLDLTRYRFQFNIFGFPRLSWLDKEADRSLVKEFLTKLKFYTSQAKEDEMENIIKKKMKEYYNTDININTTFLNVHNRIQKWWQQPGEVTYITEICDYFDRANKPELLNTLKLIHTNEVNYGISFSTAAILSLDIETFITHTDQQIFNIITNNLTLCTNKVLQYFRNNDKERNNYSIIDLKYILQNNLYTDLLKELKETPISHLIIKLTISDIASIELKNIINGEFKKKIIFITDKKLFGEPFIHYNHREAMDETNRFIDLSEESQKKLLDEVEVSFQDHELNLGKLLIDQECKDLINSNMLHELLAKRKLEIGKSLSNDTYRVIHDFYICRKLQRHVKIGFTILGTLEKDAFKHFFVTYNAEINESDIKPSQDILLVCRNNESYEALCKKFEYNVHWFKKENNEYIWQKSRGSLKKIRPYLDKNVEKQNYPSGIVNTLDDIDDDTVILASGAGMGKSCLLTHLSIETKKKDPTLWIVRINLLKHVKELSEWKEDNIDIDKKRALQFLYNAINFRVFDDKKHREVVIESLSIDRHNKINLTNNIEKHIAPLALLELLVFNYLFNHHKVVLLLDGFDEITPDYKEETIKLLKVLKNTRITKLWITTRPYNDIQQELELELDTISYSLQEFSKPDQISFLEKYFINQPGIVALNLNELISIFQGLPKSQQDAFFTIPVHILMFLEILQCIVTRDMGLKCQSLEDIIKEFNLGKLYEHFINIKIRAIRISEKSNSLNVEDPYIKRIIKRECDISIRNHKILAAAAIFHGDRLKHILSKTERKDLTNSIESFNKGEEKIGIIDSIIHDVPRFVHFTFAEYFVMELFCDKLKLDTVSNIVLDLFFKELLQNNHNTRRFFNSKLGSDRQLVTILSSNENCCEIIFEILIDNEKLSLLTAAVKEDLIYIVDLCHKVINKSLNQSNVICFMKFINHSDLFHFSLRENKSKFVLYLLEIVKKFRIVESFEGAFQKSYSLFFANTLKNAIIFKDQEIINFVLLNHNDLFKNQNQIVEFFTSTIDFLNKSNLLHIVTQYNGIDDVNLLLSKLNGTQLLQIATSVMNYGRTPAHVAGRNKNFDFFKFFQPRLNKKEFRQLCLVRNERKETPMDNIIEGINITGTIDKIFFDEYCLLCQHILPSNDDEEIDFKEDFLYDSYKLIAGNKFLFEYLNIDNKWFVDKMIEDIKNISSSNNDEDVITTLLWNAFKSDNKNFIDILFANIKHFNKYLQLLTTKCDRFILHAISDSLSIYLNKLSKQQLIQFVSTADWIQRTSMHEAAERKNFNFINIFKSNLHKEDFRKICLSPDKHNLTPVDILFENIFENDKDYSTEDLNNYFLLCEYICPSDDENETYLNNDNLYNAYKVMTGCKSLFKNLNTNNESNITKKMLHDIKRWCTSDNSDEFNAGATLFYRALLSRNDVIINSLRESLNDSEQIVKLLEKKFGPLNVTMLHSCNQHCTVDAILLFLDKLTTAQLIYVTTIIDYRGQISAHVAAKRKQFNFLNYLQSNLNKKEFRNICFTNTFFEHETPIYILVNSKNQTDHMDSIISLLKYIYPSQSDSESNNNLNRQNLQHLYKLVVEHKSLFDHLNNENHTVVRDIIHVIRHSILNIKTGQSIGVILLKRAVFSNNVSLFRVLFEIIDDVEEIANIVIVECNSKEHSLLHLVACRNNSIISACLDKLGNEQLLKVLTDVDEWGLSPMHVAVRSTNIDFLEYIKKRLSKEDFNLISSIKCKRGLKPVDYLINDSRIVDPKRLEQIEAIRNFFVTVSLALLHV